MMNSAIPLFYNFQVNSTFRDELLQWWRETLVPTRQARRPDDPNGQEMQLVVSNGNGNGNLEIVSKETENLAEKVDV